MEKAVAEIMDDVQSNGDEAICRYLEKFDGVKLTPPEFLVSEAEIAEAEQTVDPEMKRAISNALEHIRAFTLKTLPPFNSSNSLFFFFVHLINHFSIVFVQCRALYLQCVGEFATCHAERFRQQGEAFHLLVVGKLLL